jgi:hypothetical protein
MSDAVCIALISAGVVVVGFVVAVGVFHNKITGIELSAEHLKIAMETKVLQVENGQSAIQDRLETQRKSIRDQQQIINEVFIFGVAFYLVAMLRDFRRLASAPGGEYIFHKTESFAHNLRHLRDLGFIEMIKIGELREAENILPKVKLTPAGELFLDLREELEAEHRTREASSGVQSHAGGRA